MPPRKCVWGALEIVRTVTLFQGTADQGSCFPGQYTGYVQKGLYLE